MRKSFTWLLGLLVLLTSFGTHAVAQEVQSTVELYAEDASYCYGEANEYTVKVAVKDFIKITSFELNLVYNDAIFQYDGLVVLDGLLTNVSDASSTPGVITLEWDEPQTTIGDNVKTDLLELNFSVVGFPGIVAPTLSSNLSWGTTEFRYEIPGTPPTDDVNTDNSYDGKLTVNSITDAIETTIAAESCAGGDVTLTVTAPDADMYLFNEDPVVANWVWSSSPDYQAAAGDVVTVRVKDADGCISHVETVV
ncbi:MAG TPA: hypothetical protein VKA10_09885, partial [Prolixibacteraceae bacterium]|nr:hypothetical protein [Prolixibacteraceae bacterium]